MNNSDIIDYLNKEFKPEEFTFDYALNGLIVQNSGKITKIGTAVDPGIETFCEAKKQKIDFLITHHGLIERASPSPLTDIMYKKIKTLINNDIAYYSIHYPLDVNATFSNNVAFYEHMNWDIYGTFANHQGYDFGVYTDFHEAVNIEDIIEKLSSIFSKKPDIWAFGDYMIKRAGFISGNGINHLNEAYERGIDLLISGEPSHKMYWKAYEMGIKCIFLGHYATETFGVDKLGKYLADNFNLDYTFIDLATGT